MKTTHAILAAMLALTLQPLVWAQSRYESMPRVSDEVLESLRGGFDLTPFLQVSIGIERVVLINGELVATSKLNISGLTNQLAQSTPLLAQLDGVGLNLIQNGPGNTIALSPPNTASSPSSIAVASQPTVTPGQPRITTNPSQIAINQPLNLPSASTIIQNTLNNQAITSLTTIDAKVMSLNIFRNLQMSLSMSQALRRPGR